MSPPDRRRRRAHRFTLVGLVAAAVLLTVLIGAVLRVGRTSGPYWRTIDRSYAAQATVLVDRSNRTAVQLRSVLRSVAGQSRTEVQAELDLLVRTTSSTARAAAALEPPAPWEGLGASFAGALGDRARGVVRLRNAVEGLLGMSAPSTTTTAARSGGTAGSGTELSTGQAASALGGVGSLLERADRSYAQVRRAFRRAPGHPRLPTSRWVTDPGRWAAGPVATVVDQIVSSPTLAPVHQVVLVPHAVSVTPPAVPQPPAAAGATSLLRPTRSVTVTGVVANRGNVVEHHLTVTATVQPLGAVAGARRSTRTVSLAPGRSVAVRLPPLPVLPGHTYDLTVSVTAPAGQDAGAGTTQTFAVEVASDVSPPPTTTTTTTTQPASTSGSTRTSG